MKKTPLITSLSALASASLISASAGAAGFQINEHSATGLGRAFAGDAVIGDNASVLSRNAAAMTLFKRDAMSISSIQVYLLRSHLTRPQPSPMSMMLKVSVSKLWYLIFITFIA